MVAMEQAARPIPVSDVDQIATSVVAYRKSAWSARPLTYGMRTIVAIEALDGVSYIERGKRRGTYMAAIARTNDTPTFVRLFICKSQIMKMGMIANVQSAQHEIAEYAYVASTVIFASIHVPFPPVYCVQKYAEGRHCRTKRKK